MVSSVISGVLSTIAISFVVSYMMWLIVANLPRRDRARTLITQVDREGVVLYWRPGCRYCMKLRTRLRFTRLQYVEVNIWRTGEAAAFVRSVADGNETVPTVTVAGKAMVNPSKRQLLEAVETYASHLLPRTREPTGGRG
jgi:mycoredoxin